VQVLEYVQDVQAALAEIHRALRPGGRILVWDVDWATVSWHSRDPARMDRVLRAWDRHLAHASLPRSLAPQLRAAGFEDVRTEGHVFTTIDLDPESYGGAAIPLIAGYAAGQDGILQDEVKAWEAEQRELGRTDEFYFAVVQFCFTAARPR
jgi:SAM-dependent methyltransferase